MQSAQTERTAATSGLLRLQTLHCAADEGMFQVALARMNYSLYKPGYRVSLANGFSRVLAGSVNPIISQRLSDVKGNSDKLALIF